jgi:hypothetical protein
MRTAWAARQELLVLVTIEREVTALGHADFDPLLGAGVEHELEPAGREPHLLEPAQRQHLEAAWPPAQRRHHGHIELEPALARQVDDVLHAGPAVARARAAARAVPMGWRSQPVGRRPARVRER